MTIRTSSFVSRSFLTILMLLAAPKYAAQAADFDRHYDIVATDGAFNPSLLVAQPGERIHITVYNRGRMNHSIVFILPQGYIGMRRVIPPWRTGSMTFQAPTVTGEYVFYCPVFNRGASGMQGLLIVSTGQ